ncbi:MAG: 7-cyano-7-deazaguanine synthase QueC [Planctomycetota bacterium]
MKSVTLLSGGLDSTVATTAALRDSAVVLAITVDYRQRAVVREVNAARKIARKLGIRHRVVKLDFLAELTTSALVDTSMRLPFLSDGELDDLRGVAEESMRQVWVPNRNGLFVQIAASFAEGLAAEQVVVGFNREEAGTFPDNSAEFLERANSALALSTLTGVRLVSPTIGLDKQQIVRLGYELNAPLAHLWSCYAGGRRHCRSCESCLRLLRALDAAGVKERFLEEWREANDDGT